MTGAGLYPLDSTIYETYMFRILWSYIMGIVNIEDDLHEQVRRASKVSYRSINAQAAF